MDLDPVFLSRLQFAFLISFHIIFPSFTIGLAAWLATIEGTVPDLALASTGCRFAPRCPFAEDRCRGSEPALRDITAALDRIRDHHAPLGDHLARAVHTGALCTYAPDPRAPIVWMVTWAEDGAGRRV